MAVLITGHFIQTLLTVTAHVCYYFTQISYRNLGEGLGDILPALRTVGALIMYIEYF